MKVGIVGLGLIGGSIGRAAVKTTDCTVYAYDDVDDVMLKGALLNAYHEPLDGQNASDVDLLILSVYPKDIEKTVDFYAPLMKEGAVIMDCCGTKREVCAVMKRKSELYPDINFVGGHPMAGREFSGIEHSDASLFARSTCLLVPVSASIDALGLIKSFFLSIGAAGVVVTTADEHDRIIAYTSQLAHIVSSAYVMNPTALTSYGFTAGSFRDLTRVARLNPLMWTELMLENSDNLTNDVDAIMERLGKLRDALKSRDGAALESLLAEGNERKLEIDARRAAKLANVLH